MWTEFEVERSGEAPVIQRLRWINPGRFGMGGSGEEIEAFRPDWPEGIVDWLEREAPRHEVTLTRGYWLFDTPCPQALWEAVTGDNPSRFGTPDRQVEQVS